jgi:hypothetical protein
LTHYLPLPSLSTGADFTQELLLVAEGKGHHDVVNQLMAEGAGRSSCWMGIESEAAVISEAQRLSEQSQDRGEDTVHVDVGAESEKGGRSSIFIEGGEEVLSASLLY